MPLGLDAISIDAYYSGILHCAAFHCSPLCPCMLLTALWTQLASTGHGQLCVP